MEEIGTAEALARSAHDEQKDKAGRPYTEHLERVVQRVKNEDKAAAWLHDVIEDTEWTADDLTATGISEGTAATVTTLTRTKQESYKSYVRRVAESGNAAAVRIKIADIDDHLHANPGVLGKTMKRRYAQALHTLTKSAARPEP